MPNQPRAAKHPLIPPRGMAPDGHGAAPQTPTLTQTLPAESSFTDIAPALPSADAVPSRLAILADRLARSMAVARALVRSGRTLDLAGLDDGVGLLCAQTLDLAPNEARAMLPLLDALSREIDALTAALRDQAQRATSPLTPECRMTPPEPTPGAATP